MNREALNRSILEAPFDASVRKTRQGAFGKELHYVEAQHYIRRLNDAFGSEWSWRIIQHDIHGSEVVVIGALEAEGVLKHSFGGSSITTNSQTGEVVSIANDLKSAATDALKKACSFFGIGLELYGGIDDAMPSHRTHSGPQGVQNGNGARNHGNGRYSSETNGSRSYSSNSNGRSPSGNNGNGSPDRNRLTAKQLKALYAISHSQQMSDWDLKGTSVEAFGVAPEFLSRQQASHLIDTLNGN